MSDLENVLTAALRLPVAARAAIAAELIDSLDQAASVETDVEEAWTAEAEQRLAEVDSGAVKPVPWHEARGRILAASRGEREAP